MKESAHQSVVVVPHDQTPPPIMDVYWNHGINVTEKTDPPAVNHHLQGWVGHETYRDIELMLATMSTTLHIPKYQPAPCFFRGKALPFGV